MAYLGVIPRYLVLDNFPGMVVGTDPFNPRLARGFLKYAQHRGFITDPTRTGHPKDKPKVERQVPYARERFFQGGQFHDLSDLRQQLHTLPERLALARRDQLDYAAFLKYCIDRK